MTRETADPFSNVFGRTRGRTSTLHGIPLQEIIWVHRAQLRHCETIPAFNSAANALLARVDLGDLDEIAAIISESGKTLLESENSRDYYPMAGRLLDAIATRRAFAYQGHSKTCMKTLHLTLSYKPDDTLDKLVAETTDVICDSQLRNMKGVTYAEARVGSLKPSDFNLQKRLCERIASGPIANFFHTNSELVLCSLQASTNSSPSFQQWERITRFIFNGESPQNWGAMRDKLRMSIYQVLGQS